MNTHRQEMQTARAAPLSASPARATLTLRPLGGSDGAAVAKKQLMPPLLSSHVVTNLSLVAGAEYEATISLGVGTSAVDRSVTFGVDLAPPVASAESAAAIVGGWKLFGYGMPTTLCKLSGSIASLVTFAHHGVSTANRPTP